MNFKLYKYIVGFFVLGFISEVHAQAPFHAGFSLGAVSAQVDGDGFGGYNKSGISAGLWVSRKFNDKYSYLIEIAYRPKGSKNNFQADSDDINYYNLSLHYVEIPITLRYHYEKYFFDFSIGAAYLAHDNVEGLIGYWGSNSNTGFNKFDMITAVGLGVNLNEYWYVTAHFTYSVFDAARYYETYNAPHVNMQFNNAISVCLYRKIGTIK